MTKSTEQLRAIFETQVALLHEKAENYELDGEDIKKLETLTRAWKTFNSTDVKAVNPEDRFAEMSVEQLLELARSEN